MKDAVAYLDPPYLKTVLGPYRDYYDHLLTIDQHKQLADLLNNTKMKWVLSYDDHPFIREWYENWQINKINIPYSIADSRREGANNKQDFVDELVITNFRTPKIRTLDSYLSPG